MDANKGQASNKPSDDAIELAQLIYDMYIESKDSAKVINGQNNAKQNQNS